MAGGPASRKALICRIVYSCIGIVIGLSVLIAWLQFILPKTGATIHIAVSGGLSGVLATWNLVAHVMHLQDYWRTWLKGLKCFMGFGVLFMIISAAGFVAYLVIGLKHNQDLTVSSFYIACVWCFVTFKWATLLFWHSRSYRNEYSDLTELLDF